MVNRDGASTYGIYVLIRADMGEQNSYSPAAPQGVEPAGISLKLATGN